MIYIYPLQALKHKFSYEVDTNTWKTLFLIEIICKGIKYKKSGWLHSGDFQNLNRLIKRLRRRMSSKHSWSKKLIHTWLKMFVVVCFCAWSVRACLFENKSNFNIVLDSLSTYRWSERLHIKEELNFYKHSITTNFTEPMKTSFKFFF